MSSHRCAIDLHVSQDPPRTSYALKTPASCMPAISEVRCCTCKRVQNLAMFGLPFFWACFDVRHQVVELASFHYVFADLLIQIRRPMGQKSKLFLASQLGSSGREGGTMAGEASKQERAMAPIQSFPKGRGVPVKNEI